MNTGLQTKTRSCEDQEELAKSRGSGTADDAPLTELGTADGDESDTKKHARRQKRRTREKKCLRSSSSSTAGASPDPKRNKRRKHKSKRARSTSSSAAEDKRQQLTEDLPKHEENTERQLGQQWCCGGWRQESWWREPWWENKGWEWRQGAGDWSWGQRWEGESMGRSSAPPGEPPAQPDKDGYYATLGLTMEATQTEITAAYRKLALRVHPDKGGNAALFASVSQAHRVLSDPGTREAYDLACGHEPPPCDDLDGRASPQCRCTYHDLQVAMARVEDYVRSLGLSVTDMHDKMVRDTITDIWRRDVGSESFPLLQYSMMHLMRGSAHAGGGPKAICLTVQGDRSKDD